jgi:AbrB family looped-hinge helix DNA binding protein
MNFETEFKTTKMNASSRIYISKDIRNKLGLEEGEIFKIKTNKENKSILLEVVK